MTDYDAVSRHVSDKMHRYLTAPSEATFDPL